MAAALAPESGSGGPAAAASAAVAAPSALPLLEAAAPAKEIDMSTTVPVEAADGKTMDAPIEALKQWGFTKELLDGEHCCKAERTGCRNKAPKLEQIPFVLGSPRSVPRRRGHPRWEPTSRV